MKLIAEGKATNHDRLGNVVAVTDANGDLARVYDQMAFGTLKTYGRSDFDQTATDVPPYHLTTKEYDSDARLASPLTSQGSPAML